MSLKQSYVPLIDNTQSVNITSGQQVSGTLDVEGMSLVGVRLPAAFTGTTISIQESDSASGTFRDIYNTSGLLASFPVSINRTVLFSPTDLAGLRFIKLKSNTAEAADRSISCILRAL